MELVRQKNVATYIFFPIIDADGDVVTGAAGLDSELNYFSDGAAPQSSYTDCTNEATEIGSTGWYYLSLAQSEMNHDYISIQVKTSTSGAKTQHILIRTMIGDPLNIGTTTTGYEIGVASDGDLAKVNILDGHTAQTGDTYPIVNHADYGNSKLVRSTTPANTLTVDASHQALSNVNHMEDDVITDAAIAADAEYTLDEIAAAMWDRLLTAITTSGSVGLTLKNILADLANGGRLDLLIDSLIATLGVAGAGLTALGDARLANLDAAVTSRLAASGYTAPDNAGIDAAEAAIIILDGLLDDVKVVTERLNTMFVVDGAVYKYTANALEESPTGTGGFTAGDRTVLESLQTQLGIKVGNIIVPV